ncbi:Wadjet anti-phage system protein JetD domain-containing protein [Stenotrophobium rhamnosiphilum]|uniref:Wadjet protein JetD C-terminal domain-containing protein n=1 Tax=Stenotrophobium rhamnosiphilum TaxID=2029166 RepID=A0A2T5MBP5_9GAMM|nr:Wadjet anti-phage system protein JetD domain-containing protein [Stenotrophobium rhamnosiphilum]PTU29138.1 hypothetical protein CJD38_17470 [Stenotrophobium rhamnosiphilum]
MSTELAKKALRKLLKSAENAKTRGSVARGLPFSEASFPEYLKPRSLAELTDLHNELVAAERIGAISIQWDHRSGDRGHVIRIDLQNEEALARFLDVIPLWTLLSTAKEKFQPRAERPQVAALLEAWANGKRPRERGPEHVDAFVQAMRVIDEVEGQTDGALIAVRRMSAQLFHDSKKIEELFVELDLLTRADDGPNRSPDEIYSELGLQRFPQPFFMAAAPGNFYYIPTGAQREIESPYSAPDPETIKGFRFTGRYILSVENLTLFQELARGLGGPIDGLILYSAGMPSPRWLQAYKRVLAEAAPAQVFHWGDPDVGGIRAMRKIALAARSISYELQPFAMDEEVAGHRKEFTDAEVNYICRVCNEFGWASIADRVTKSRGAVEQESQKPRLPLK